MIEINLLPWRYEAREKKAKYLQHVLFSILCLMIIVLFFAHLGLKYWLVKEKMELARLKKKIASQAVQVQIIKTNQQEYQQLQSALLFQDAADRNRALWLNFINNLLLNTPAEISFTDLIYNKKQIILSGVSHTALALSQITKKIHKAQIIEITNANPATHLKFQLQVAQNEVPPSSVSL